MRGMFRVVSFFVLLVGAFAAADSVNPWILDDRLALYKQLLNVTYYPPLFGDDNSGNILWGLPLQMEWQNRSGRLMIQNDTNIFGKSWWGCMNYYLSAVPYIGAMNAGVIPTVTVLPPPDNDSSKFCISNTQCNMTLLSKWTTYFKTIQQVQAGTQTITVDDAMVLLWDAHTTSIRTAMKIFIDELNYLASGQEVKFGVGWGNFVQIIAAAQFRTNSSEVDTMQVDLPYRMLLANDEPGSISDFTKNMNVACEAMFLIADLHNTTAYRIFLEEWEYVMKDAACRAKAQVMINNFFTNPVKEVIQYLMELVILCK